MAVVEGLAARHHVGKHRAQVCVAVREIGQVDAGDDRLDAVER
jgi:hypothetical protein